VWRVWGQEEHFAFGDYYVAEGAFVDYFEHHGAAVLVEPFGGFVDVVVGAGVGTAYDLEFCEKESFEKLGGAKVYHDCHILVIDAVVVDRWFEEMGVLFEPVEVL
jgi:hypothetical protein